MCAKMIHATSSSRGPDASPSPSPARRPAGSPGRARCRSGSRPTPAPGRAAATSSGQVGLEPGAGPLDQRGAADVGDGELVPVLAASRSGAAARCRPAGRRRSGTRRSSRRSGIAVQLGQHLDGGVLQFAPLLGGRVGEPVVAERVGHDVGRDDARRRSPSGRTGCRAPRRSAPATAPAGPGRRSVRRPAGSPRTGGPAGTTGTPGRLGSVGATRATHFCSTGLAVLVPAAGQDDGLRRHPVGVDAAFHGHLRRRRRRASRWTATATSPRAACGDVPARAL